jgi:hypothetical protein
LAAKISVGRAQDLADVAALRDSAKQENDHQDVGSTGSSSATDQIRRTQARGRQERLEMRRKQKAEELNDDRSKDPNPKLAQQDSGEDLEDESDT